MYILKSPAENAEGTRGLSGERQGVQYASREYVATLRQKHVRISMTENGNPKDNAIAERINLTIKYKLLSYCLKISLCVLLSLCGSFLD